MQMLRLAAADHDQFPLFVIQLLFIGHFLHHLLPISLELAERPYTSGVKNASSSLVLLSRLNQPELFKLPNRAQHGLPAYSSNLNLTRSPISAAGVPLDLDQAGQLLSAA
jgi:hypothetical protein